MRKRDVIVIDSSKPCPHPVFLSVIDDIDKRRGRHHQIDTGVLDPRRLPGRADVETMAHHGGGTTVTQHFTRLLTIDRFSVFSTETKPLRLFKRCWPSVSTIRFGGTDRFERKPGQPRQGNFSKCPRKQHVGTYYSL